MGQGIQQQDLARSKIMLDLLESVDRESQQSQRTLAVRFGVAVGLVNAYLKICIRKGYIRVRRLPAHRRAYLLTPRGMAEKTRLTLLLLSNQLELFRRARANYAEVLREARGRGWRRVVLIGASELAEICTICAREADIEIIALIDAGMAKERLGGVPVMPSIAGVSSSFDGALITDIHAPTQNYSAAIAALGCDRVLAPAFLGLSAPRGSASA